MTHLRKMMLEELERRNYAQTTIDCYLRAVAEFSFHFHCSPSQLGTQHIRQYQAHLFRQRKLAPSTVTQHLAALRFFYIKTLRKPWSIAETPYPKKVQRLPIILSPEEVTQLINSALTPFHRILLMTLYATGVRRAELARLKITDIDSRRMIIHIQGGKGRKDRDVMLSPTLLEALREYWRGLRRKPTHWRDRAHNNEEKLLPLSLDEFLRRFLLHLLPRGFVRIPHFGFLANRRRATLLPLCFQLLGPIPQPQIEPAASADQQPSPFCRCPNCGGTMVIIQTLTAFQILLRSPPSFPRAA